MDHCLCEGRGCACGVVDLGEALVAGRLDGVQRGAAIRVAWPREAAFAVVDAAFSQRRKTMRAALAGWAGSAAEAETRLRAAGCDVHVLEAAAHDTSGDLVHDLALAREVAVDRACRHPRRGRRGS